jgi:hypothetical protein
MTTSLLNSSGPHLKALLLHNHQYSVSLSSLALHDPFTPTDEAEESPLSRAESEQSPVLCTSALRLMKTVGVYVALSKAFTPVSFDIFAEVINLIEFFVTPRQVYSVYALFTTEGSRHMLFTELSTAKTSEQLETQYDTYLLQHKFANLKLSAVRIKDCLDSIRADDKLSTAPLRRSLSSTNANLYLLSERLVALESCRHVRGVVAQAHEFLSQVISEEQVTYMDYFLAQTQASIEELDQFITETEMPRLVRLEMVLGQISSIRWNEASEDSNNYIDRVLHVFDDLKHRLRALAGGSLPRSLQGKVLREAFAFTCNQLIECFAKVKRCSTAGRRQMEVDLLAFRDALSEVGELPSIEAHLEYLQVWRESPEAILEFMLRRSELPLRLHRLLLATAPQLMPMNVAKRSQMLGRLEEQCRSTLEM